MSPMPIPDRGLSLIPSPSSATRSVDAVARLILDLKPLLPCNSTEPLKGNSALTPLVLEHLRIHLRAGRNEAMKTLAKRELPSIA